MNQVLGRAQEYSFNQPLSFRSMNYTVRNIVNSSKITLLRKEGKHVLDGMSRFSGTMQNWWTWVTENIVSCLSRLFHCSSPHHHHFTVWASLIDLIEWTMGKEAWLKQIPESSMNETGNDWKIKSVAKWCAEYCSENAHASRVMGFYFLSRPWGSPKSPNLAGFGHQGNLTLGSFNKLWLFVFVSTVP